MNLREKMLAMLDSTRVEELHEIAGNILLSVSRAIMLKANVYIWADIDLHTYVRLFKSRGLNVHRVVSFMPKDFQKVDDVEVISTIELFQDKTPNKFFFVDACAYPMKNPAAFWNEQMNFLQPLGVHFVDGNDRQSLVANVIPFDTDKSFYYQSHKKDLINLFDSLADETSKRALCFYVESFVKNCIYRSEQNPTRWKYFFGGKYERLYNFAAMLKNLSLLPPDKRALVESINQMIDEQTDFEKILAGNKCTLLNADIEGAELKLLHATEKIIRTDRPVMATANRFFMPCPSSAVVVRDKKISNDIMAARNLAA